MQTYRCCEFNNRPGHQNPNAHTMHPFHQNVQYQIRKHRKKNQIMKNQKCCSPLLPIHSRLFFSGWFICCSLLSRMHFQCDMSMLHLKQTSKSDRTTKKKPTDRMEEITWKISPSIRQKKCSNANTFHHQFEAYWIATIRTLLCSICKPTQREVESDTLLLLLLCAFNSVIVWILVGILNWLLSINFCLFFFFSSFSEHFFLFLFYLISMDLLDFLTTREYKAWLEELWRVRTDGVRGWGRSGLGDFCRSDGLTKWVRINALTFK